jgi:dihydrolipoamide dehydrogenase
MHEKVDVAIIGAGSAGLSALRRVREQTDSFVVIQHGPLGTKCARTGCMPSKALISVSRDFHRYGVIRQKTLCAGKADIIDIRAVLHHVRSLRDMFSSEMANTTGQLARGHLVLGQAQILSPNRIRVENRDITAQRIIIATGSRPLLPHNWESLGDKVLTSETIFEQDDLPARMAVIGLGPVGLELGQALSRLGISITGFTMKNRVGITTNPDINEASLRIFRSEFPIHLGASAELTQQDNDLLISTPDQEVTVDAAIVAIGVVPDISGLGLENLGLELDEAGLPPFDPRTTQIADLPVFIAGDVNGCRPILHEAVDEGSIAGRNSTAPQVQCYCRRTPLHIVFSDPDQATVGLTYQQLQSSGRSFVTGHIDFGHQARALLEMRGCGLLQVYVDAESAQILGAEMVCHHGEHLAHQLAMAIENDLTVFDMLQAPFYHPSVEEGLRTALMDAARQISEAHKFPDLSLCDICPESPLC